MRKKLVFVIFAAYIAQSFVEGRNDGNCSIEGIDFAANIYRNPSILDSDLLNLEFKYTEPLEIQNVTSDRDPPFLEVNAADGILTFSNTNTDFDAITNKQEGTQARTYLQINFYCKTGTTALLFYQDVNDTNNHPPSFGQEIYEYILPTLIPPQFDLTSLGPPLVASDLDFSNQIILYTVDDARFIVDSSSSETSKDYPVSLKAASFIRIIDDITFTITATDGGSPPLSSSATIILKGDPDNSVPGIPTFSAATYNFKYESTDDGVNLKDDGNPIKLNTSDPVKTEVSIEPQDLITPEYNSDTNEVHLTWTGEPIPSTTEPVLQFVLTVTLDGESSHSTILVFIPADHVISTPTFTRTYYTAKYNTETSPHSVTLDDDQTIAIFEQQTTTISLSDDDDKHFSISRDTNDQWTLSVEHNLDPDTLNKGGDVILTLAANFDELDEDQVRQGAATIIVKLPSVATESGPKFLQVFYTGDYVPPTDDSEASVNLHENFIKTDLITDVRLLDSENFALEKGEDESWNVVVSSPISTSDLEKGKVYEFILQTQVPDDSIQPSTATLVITVTPLAVPKFVEPYYKARYTVEDGQGKVDLDNGPISVTPADNVQVVVEESEHSENFDIACDPASGTCEFKVKTNLPDEVVTKGEDVVLSLRASSTGDDYGSSTLVILSFTEPEAAVVAKFSRPYYRAKYVVDKEGLDTLQMSGPPIAITSPTDQTVSVNLAEAMNNFKISEDPINKNIWVVSVINDLPDDTIQKGAYQFLTLQARTENGNPLDVGIAILVIEVDPDRTPKFTQTIYEAVYSDDDEGSVSLAVPVALDDGAGDVAFVGTYAEYFSFKLDSNPQITVDQKLGNIIGDYQEILLTLQVSLPTSLDQEESVVRLKLPFDESSDYLKFKEKAYIYTYASNFEPPVLEGPIIDFVESVSDVTFTLTGNHKENFEVVKNDDATYSFKLLSALDNVVISSESDILLILDASSPGLDNGFATILINLPKKQSEVDPHFVKPLYIGKYVPGEDDNDTVDLEEVITLQNEEDDEHISLAGSYSQYFSIIHDTDNNGYIVQVDNDLPQDILNKETDIVLTVTVTREKSGALGLATLVIQLPKQAVPASFSRAFYLAEYHQDSHMDFIKVQTSIELQGDNLATTKVRLEGELAENFDVTSSSPYNVTLNKDIDTTILFGQPEIVITLVAYLEDDGLTYKSPIIINTPDSTTDIIPKFSKLYYFGTYSDTNGGSVSIKPIPITSDHSSETDVKVVGDYSDNFSAVKNSDGLWTIRVTTALSDSVLTKMEIIVLNLEASLADAKDVGKAIVILDLPTDELKPSPVFSDSVYTARYNREDNTVSYINDSIKITSMEKDAANLKLDQWNDNFHLYYDDDKDEWGIDVLQPLNSDLFKSNPELVIGVSSHLDHHSVSSASLVIQLPGREIVQFSKSHYEATYQVNHDGIDFVILEDIVVTDGASVVISENYDGHFDIKRNTPTKYQLFVKSQLSETDLLTKNEVVLVVEATKDDTEAKGSATILVALPLQDELEAPQFKESLYITTYTEDSISPVDLSIVGVDDVTKATVYLNEDDKSYFNVIPKGDHWELTSTNPLPSDVIDGNFAFIFVVKAMKPDVKSVGLANILIELPQKTTTSKFHFDKDVYMGTYTSENSFSVEDLVIDGADGDFDISVEGENKESFTCQYQEGRVIVTLNDPIKLDVIRSKVTIALKIRAAQDEDEAVTTLIVELPKIQDPSKLFFGNSVYSAKYEVNADDADTVVLEDGPIVIDDVSDTANIDIQLDAISKENFDLIADDSGGWTITVINKLDPSFLQNNPILFLTVTAIDENKKTGQTTVAVQLPKSAFSLHFNSNAYMADYTVKNSKPSLNVQADITVSEPISAVSLVGDYKQFFRVAYKNDGGNVAISVSANDDEIIPVKDYKKSVISVDVKATAGSESTTATLVVKLPKSSEDNDDDDETGLIVAVSVLAVLLVAALVGSAVFYFLKFRRGTEYSNTEEEAPRISERFQKNSNSVDTRKFEHPTRRPTGLIKYPLGETAPGETNTDEEPFEKRKSVQFDVINIDEREIEKSDEDLDDSDHDESIVDPDETSEEAPKSDEKSDSHIEQSVI